MTQGKRASRQLLYAVSVFSSLGVFLFGFDQGSLSALITGPYFKAYFHRPEPAEIALMVSVLQAGALVTSLVAGRIGDIYGRRVTLMVGAIVFILGGAFQTFTMGFRSMVFGRIISGFGVGFLSMIVPVYQSEISPAENRGQLACIEFTGNIVGYASSVWIGYFASFIKSDLSWRLPLGMQCIIGSILAVGVIFIPESPRWLLDTDQDEQGMRVLADLHGDGNTDDEKAKEEFREIKSGILADRLVGDRSYGAMWTRYRSRVLIAMSAQAFAQLNGINVISYYAPLVFESAGWIGRDALLMTGINAMVYIASTIPTWYLVDVVGRKPILLCGAVMMAAALSSISYFLYLDASYTPVAVVVSVVLFNAAFGLSWGPIPWLLGPEIMPLPFRVKGVSISTATNWLFNWLVGESTPILQNAIRWRLYLIHAGFCICSFFLVYFTYPETMGVTLEDMDRLFGDVPLHSTDEESSLVQPTASEIEPPKLKSPRSLSPNSSKKSKSWFGAGGREGGERENRTNYQSVNAQEEGEGEERG